MAQNIGTLLGAPIRPADSLDQFPAFYANEGKGGFYSVEDITTRDAISSDRREVGMRVKVISENKDYELVGGITNGDWVEKVYSGVGTFTDLSDTPNTYTGQAGKKVVVNTGETGLDFVEDNVNTQDLQSVLLNGDTTDIRPDFQDGVKVPYIVTDDATFKVPEDETGSPTLATREWVADNVNGETNLGYTPSPTNGIVTSDTGTDATIPLADSTNAGLLSPAEKTKLTGIANNANNYVHPNHSGDVTSVGDGVQTIANQAVTNAKFRNSTAHTVVGRAGSGNGSVADIGLSNDTILGRQGSGNVEGLSVSQVQSMLGFDNKQNIPIVRTGNFTPTINSVNHVTANATVTNPTGVEGLGYIVKVLNGTTTMPDGSTNVKHTTIEASFVSGTWQYYVITHNSLKITTSVNIATSLLWENRKITIINGANNINLTINHEIDFFGSKGVGNVQFVAGTTAIDSLTVPSGLLAGAEGSTFSVEKKQSATNTVSLILNPL